MTARLDEEYFLLRLPVEHASVLRRMMRESPNRVKKNLQIQFVDDAMRYAEITMMQQQRLPAKMVDLPTIIEASKSTHPGSVLKLGNISQMLYVGATDELEAQVKNSSSSQWPHGLAMPMKNVRRRRFRKMTQNPDAARAANDVQKEVEWLLRTDNEAIATRYEIIYEEVEQKLNIVTKETLFGELSDSD